MYSPFKCLNFNIVHNGRVLKEVLNFNNRKHQPYNIYDFKYGRIVGADIKRQVFIGQITTVTGQRIELVADVPFLALTGPDQFYRMFYYISQCQLVPNIPVITI